MSDAGYQHTIENDLLIELGVGGDAKVTLNGTRLEKCNITIKLEYDFQDEADLLHKLLVSQAATDVVAACIEEAGGIEP